MCYKNQIKVTYPLKSKIVTTKTYNYKADYRVTNTNNLI